MNVVERSSPVEHYSLAKPDSHTKSRKICRCDQTLSRFLCESASIRLVGQLRQVRDEAYL